VIVSKALKVADDAPVLRAAEDRDAQDLFGLLSLCFADYPGFVRRDRRDRTMAFYG
jgi:hypothetical protein